MTGFTRFAGLLAAAGMVCVFSAGSATADVFSDEPFATPLPPGEAVAASSLQFQYHIQAEEVPTNSQSTFTACFLNEGGAQQLLNPNSLGGIDHLAIGIPVGLGDFDLLADAGALTCSPPLGWSCFVDLADPALARVVMEPSGFEVTVGAEQTVCFDLEGGLVNGAQGLVRVYLTQSIARFALAPVNEFVKVYKSDRSLLALEAGTNIEITGANNRIDVAPQGVGSGLDADLLDGLESNNYDASQAELDAETAARIAGDIHAGDVAGPHNALVIQPNAVTSPKILDNTIVSADIANGTIANIDMAPNSINSANIIDGSVVSADIADGTVALIDMAANSVDSSKIVDNTVASADILNGTVANIDMAANSINSSNIVDGSVVSADIADGTVALVDMAANSVDSSKIVDNSVTSADIADGTVSGVDLAANSVDTTKIVDGQVMTADLANAAATLAKLAADSVDSSKIVDLSVSTADLANAAATLAKLAADSVDSSKIVDGSVATADLANLAVTLGKLAANSVDSSKIVDGSVALVDLGANSVDSARIVNDTVTGADILNGTIQAIDVDSTQIQERVTGSCPAGQSIRVVNQNGSVTCEVDNDTDTIADLDVRTTDFSCNGNTTCGNTRVCPPGFTVVGGGCGHRDGSPFLGTAREVQINKSAPMANGLGWHCIATNTHPTDARALVADVICMRDVTVTTSFGRGALEPLRADPAPVDTDQTWPIGSEPTVR